MIWATMMETVETKYSLVVIFLICLIKKNYTNKTMDWLFVFKAFLDRFVYLEQLYRYILFYFLIMLKA